MQKLSLWISALCLSLVFFSCSKSLESPSGSLETAMVASDAAIDLSNCKLRNIWSDNGGGTVKGTITYNSKGNPTKVLFEKNGTGNPDHYFFYDNQSRIVEWRQTYSGGTYTTERHRYVYNASGVAIRDTAMYIEGDTITDVHTFTYDGQKRIVKENIKNIWNAGAPLNPQRNPSFTYDARGNLAVGGWKSSSYDNKVSAFRSHPVFQFIFKNYSVNNAAVQAKYNSKGMPLSLTPNNDRFFNNTVISKLAYDCQ
ncbi:MAG: hypothetical protein EOO00_01445 [Chitinophagaceae bacterium]|nr:MAG: hypothetical protein EOO00_01445 [Chitinophagaceae bacterium]